MTLEVRNRKFLPVTWLHVLDQFPANLPVAGHEVRMNSVTNQGEFLSFWNPGRLRPADAPLHRRVQQAGLLHLRPGDDRPPATASECFRGRGTLSGQQRLIVYPQLYPADELRLPAKNPFGERAADAHLVEDPLRYAGHSRLAAGGRAEARPLEGDRAAPGTALPRVRADAGAASR